ncbi:response regulator [Asticcacaulis sp. ZE23SCel15]|uniref:response regulator n=1 Tax=Asticcacaulis sp. ZE23SCel15 TaxID=3059027 RepID=UPI00265F4E0C|nr:response regulator [Asticcacaulis sp. ZE23SCel15]WKL56698.1 response regulator [Asticcacaulis sp. ZE23SCel15]
MPDRVIVLDDDPELRALLQRYLGENGFAVRAVSNSTALDRALARDPADVIILDLMMPGEDELSVCRRLRAQNDRTPIIMLTARGDPVDRVLGLEMGADDYLAKPFMPRELLARIAAVLRRRNASPLGLPMEGVMHFGPFRLDLAHMRLTRDERQIELSTREFVLLRTLITHRGRPLSRAQIIALAMGRDADVTDRAVDVQIARLRKAIEDDPASPVWIRTVWGHGYLFTAEVSS